MYLPGDIIQITATGAQAVVIKAEWPNYVAITNLDGRRNIITTQGTTLIKREINPKCKIQ